MFVRANERVASWAVVIRVTARVAAVRQAQAGPADDPQQQGAGVSGRRRFVLHFRAYRCMAGRAGDRHWVGANLRVRHYDGSCDG